MLRTKQLGTLSQSARFFLNGSRCNAGDGNSCTCAEDETCISRKQNTKNAVRDPQAPSSLTPKTSVKVSSYISGDVVGTPASSPKVISTPSNLGRIGTVTYASGADCVQNDMMHPSPPMSDQFVKAGIAAVSFLSDIVSYKIPSSDGSGILNSQQSHVVERVRPLSTIKASNVKALGREKIDGKSSSGTEPRTKSKSNVHEAKGSAQNIGSVSGVNQSFQKKASQPAESERQSNFHDKRRTMPQQVKPNPNRFVPNVLPAEGKFVGEVSEDFNRRPKLARQSSTVSSMARQFTRSGNVVESVSHILRQLNWSPATEVALGKLNCSMDPYQANQVLKKMQDYSSALGFFYWLKQRPGFKHDEHTYTTMVGILGRARQFGAINNLLDQMVRDGLKPNVVTYNRLIHSYGRANYLNEAINVFNRMQEAGCKPDRVTYCTLIDIHAKSGYLDVAMDMYQRMQEAGLSPDTFTYSVIINCLGKAGHLTAADKLFCEMVSQGCVPNLVTFNIMIALHAKARNYQTSLQLYHDMQNAGFEPDKVTYSIIMEVYGHCGYLEEAEAVFAEMERKNWVPDEPVYGLLVDLWGKVGNAGKAWEWYCAMLNAGLRPNVPTCNSLLSAFLRVHRLSDAYNLLQSMLNLGLNPSLQTYTLLISCCTEAQTAFDMTFCGKLMAVTGHPAHTFLMSMPAAGPDGQNVKDHMSSFLELMHSEDRESKRGLVDAVVDFLHKSGLKEEAGSVWEVAAHKNVYPDAVREKSSCYWLINLHVMSDGTAVTALSRTLAWFRRQMLASGICPGRIDIVTGWGRRSRVTGSSLVRQSVQELLNMFQFPFYTENGNSGCFVGCGETLNRWLLQSYVERMHLL